MRDLIIECDARRERVEALLTRQRYRSGRRLQHKGRRRVRIKRSDHIEQEIVQCLLLFGAVTRAECQSQIFRALICRLPEDGNGFGIDEAAAIISDSEEHTSELQSLMRISYAVFCLIKKKNLNST